jgi:oligopeptide/dipeptide ABC transporter ATP-binding protein
LIDPTAGQIQFDNQDITKLSRAEIRPLRRKMQIIFQDPYASLDPRMKVESIITEPLRVNHHLTKFGRRAIAAELLEKVGLHTADLNKYPHEFSGGQRQRIGIARSLCVRPELIVADEPVSALDVSIQAQVINLMQDLKDEFNLSYIFISHDLSIVHHVCNRIAVMYLGVIVELAACEVFRQASRHPYTRALLSAVPSPDPHSSGKLFSMRGDLPNPIDPPKGCTFHTRCQYVYDRCRAERPPLLEISSDHYIACWLNQGQGLKVNSE